MFRMINNGEFCFLQRETNLKRRLIYIYMNMEIATNFEALKSR
jgi:hypothetical protein